MVSIDQHAVKRIIIGKIHKNMDGYAMNIRIGSIREASKRKENIIINLYTDTKTELKIIKSKEEFPQW